MAGFIFEAAGKYGLSHAHCIFKSLHLQEGCGLRIGICKLKPSFLVSPPSSSEDL